MGHINMGRVILGAIVAAVILFVGGFIIHGVILSTQWKAWQSAGHLPLAAPETTGIAMWAIVSLVNGLVGLWIYAGIRPRYGAGPKTALLAGFMLWAVGWLGTALGQFALGNVPHRIIIVGCIGGLVAALIAIVAGAYCYREE